MKLSVLATLAAVLAVASGAVQPQKQFIVSYPDETPGSVVEAAMNEIKAAGGIITHEYKIFKGFAAKASAKAIETVQAMGSEFNAIVEEDQVVSIPPNGPQ